MEKKDYITHPKSNFRICVLKVPPTLHLHIYAALVGVNLADSPSLIFVFVCLCLTLTHSHTRHHSRNVTLWLNLSPHISRVPASQRWIKPHGLAEDTNYHIPNRADQPVYISAQQGSHSYPTAISYLRSGVVLSMVACSCNSIGANKSLIPRGHKPMKCSRPSRLLNPSSVVLLLSARPQEKRRAVCLMPRTQRS